MERREISLDYLEPMDEAILKDTEVTLYLGKEFPTTIQYDFAEGNDHIEYSLSPRIQK